jgi:iron complex outermembrane receptor protein
MLRRISLFALLCIAGNSYSQFSVSGKVIDEKGNALNGANVYLKGSGNESVSDNGGLFIIKPVKKGDYTMEITFLGYQKISKQLHIDSNLVCNFIMQPSSIWGEEIIVKATRAASNTPVTFSTVAKKDIESKNLGQDIPYLLGMEPAVVYSSDAGTGVGYTGIWVRGSNIQRINVTVNGIPINDPESHFVVWVNMPDIASSAESSQVQRGVGTSTNGGGAFGATINLETDYIDRKSFGEINNSFGSFNTWKNNVRFGTGLIKEKWALEGRASSITSDGYIDRGSSNLKSFFLQGGYFTDATTAKFVIFSGKEKTYQTWNGTDKETMEKDRTFNSCGAIYDTDWNIKGFYDNETDNYQQDNYQFHVSQRLAKNLNFNGALHYTYGRGYYEQYYSNRFLGDFAPIGVQYFGFDSLFASGKYTYYYRDTVSTGDLIVRQWLDNDFYGGTFSFQYNSSKLNITLGGAANKYSDGKHYGEIIWAEFAGNSKPRDQYYYNVSEKTDINTYIKTEFKPFNKFGVFVDLQLRKIGYTDKGDETGYGLVNIDKEYLFFNPKAGFTYTIPKLGLLYASYAMAHREPIRTDFLDAPENVIPEAEVLQDIEIGLRRKSDKMFYSMASYLMLYTNQLALNGEINDVGYPIRENVGRSYRYGLEIDGGMMAFNWFSFRANIALSNSATDFKQNNNDTIKEYKGVQISYSPQVVGGIELTFVPVKNLNLTYNARYVGMQYLDLTEAKEKRLDPYFINNLRLGYVLKPKFMDEITFSLMINNIFDIEYSSNAYLYENVPYYYPQAGINFLAGISLKF